jgi:hypothetical protein
MSVLNGIDVALLMALWVWIWRAPVVRRQTVLWIHFAAYTSALAVLFPYFGETP